MIVLDTHALLWWVSGDTQSLSPTAARAIGHEMQGGKVLVSSISAWEIAMLIAKGRIGLSMDIEQWLKTVAEIPSLSFVPIDNEIALKSVELPGEFHKDPADRMIVATARKFSAPLVTADEKIQAYAHVKTLW